MENKKFDFDIYIVRSRKLSYFLQYKGFYLLRTEQSRDNPKWKVFHFANSSELRDAIQEYRDLPK